MTTKHTPGPWAVTIGRKEMREASRIHKADDQEFLIGYVICEHINEAQRAEDIANAHLFAAAPELLAACMAAQIALRSGPSRDKDYSGDLAMLKDAIDKANGHKPTKRRAKAEQ